MSTQLKHSYDCLKFDLLCCESSVLVCFLCCGFLIDAGKSERRLRLQNIAVCVL